ncbi:MAG: hypothetical protein FWG10_01100 [Eubacteriaceae bacterium]|nr:hypothetical protein [Eubacteriaceae bacterium]
MSMHELYEQRKADILKAANCEKPGLMPIMEYPGVGVFKNSQVLFKDLLNDGEAYKREWMSHYEEIYCDCYIHGNVGVYPKGNAALGGGMGYHLSPDGRSYQHVAKDNRMREDEYPLFTKDPVAFIKNTLIPRIYPKLFDGDFEEAKNAIKILLGEMAGRGPLVAAPAAQAEEEYGIVPMRGGGGSIYVALDQLFDRYRGFKNTLIDLRRNRPQLEEACNALHELFFQSFENGIPTTFPFGMHNPHIPTYIGNKDFDQLYWPEQSTVIRNVDKHGGKMIINMEGRWQKFLDNFLDLPKASVLLQVDDDDIFEVRQKVGNKFCIMGGAKLSTIITSSKQANLDYAKKVIDEVGPDGALIFGTDKMWVTPSEYNQNLIDVYEFARGYRQ